MELTKPITYFLTTGEVNTTRTFELARARALELWLKTVLVASTSGKTGALAAEFFKGFEVVVVSHSAVFEKTTCRIDQ